MATTLEEQGQCAATARARAAKASGVTSLDDFAFEEIRSVSGIDEVLDTIKACLDTGSNISNCDLHSNYNKATGIVTSTRRSGMLTA